MGRKVEVEEVYASGIPVVIRHKKSLDDNQSSDNKPLSFLMLEFYEAWGKNNWKLVEDPSPVAKGLGILSGIVWVAAIVVVAPLTLFLGVIDLISWVVSGIAKCLGLQDTTHGASDDGYKPLSPGNR